MTEMTEVGEDRTRRGGDASSFREKLGGEGVDGDEYGRVWAR
jgi:hypothetical protein